MLLDDLFCSLLLSDNIDFLIRFIDIFAFYYDIAACHSIGWLLTPLVRLIVAEVLGECFPEEDYHTLEITHHVLGTEKHMVDTLLGGLVEIDVLSGHYLTDEEGLIKVYQIYATEFFNYETNLLIE